MWTFLVSVYNANKLISTDTFRLTVMSCLGALVFLALVLSFQRYCKRTGKGGDGRTYSFRKTSYEDLPINLKSSTLTQEKNDRRSGNNARDNRYR